MPKQTQKTFEEAKRALEKLTKAGMDRSKLIGTLNVLPLLPKNVAPMDRSIRTLVAQTKRLAERMQRQNEKSGFLYEALLDSCSREKPSATLKFRVFKRLPVWLHWYASYAESIRRQRSEDRKRREGLRQFAIRRLQADIRRATGRYHDADLAMLLDAVFLAHGRREQFDEGNLRKLRSSPRPVS